MSEQLTLSAQIESILFYKGEAVSLKQLTQMLGVSESQTEEGLATLEIELKNANRGIVLLRNGKDVTLGTTPQMSAFIEKLVKEEISKDLGKAGLETLAIVLYRGPVSRSEINYIRGVNSNYILRSLEVRGLTEKTEDAKARSTMYRPTFELLSYMGVTKVEDLPEYQYVGAEVAAFKEGDKQEEE